MTISLLHTADLHLDSPLRALALRDPDLRDRVQTATRTTLRRIVDVAIEKDIAGILIAGDLFDGAERSARTAAFLNGVFDRLRHAGIRVFYIKGNHDAENPISGQIELPDNVHVFDGRGGKVALTDGIWIHGVSFSGRHASESLLPRFPAPVPGATNIALLHTSLSGAAGHDPYAPCSVGDMSAMGFDYWALGHVHRRQIHGRAPWIVMPGMPQGRDMGEAGPKSATLLRIGDGITVEEVPTSAVEFVDLAVDVTGLATDVAIREAVQGLLRVSAERLGSDTGLVRLRLTGKNDRRWHLLRDRDVWVAFAERAAQETGRLWLERLEIDVMGAQPPGAGAADALARLMAEVRGEDGFAEACRQEVDALLGEVPAHRRAALAPDAAAAAALGRRLAVEGAEAMVARLKGADTE